MLHRRSQQTPATILGLRQLVKLLWAPHSSLINWKLEKEFPHAAALLTLFGFLDRQSISKKLIEHSLEDGIWWHGSAIFPLSGDNKKRLSFLNAKPDADIDESIGQIASLSLIERFPKYGTIQIHTMVHE